MAVDWGTVARFVEALAWPAVVLCIAILLKRELVAIFRRISRLHWGDLSADLDKALDAVEAKVEEGEGTEKKIHLAAPSEDYMSSKNYLLETARKAPAEAILEAWSEVEEALLRAVPEGDSWRPVAERSEEAVEKLAEEGRIPRGSIVLFRMLKNLRNRVAQDSSQVDYATAVRYIHFAIPFANEIREGTTDRSERYPK